MIEQSHSMIFPAKWEKVMNKLLLKSFYQYLGNFDKIGRPSDASELSMKFIYNKSFKTFLDLCVYVCVCVCVCVEWGIETLYPLPFLGCYSPLE